jgi:hypothetical protein
MVDSNIGFKSYESIMRVITLCLDVKRNWEERKRWERIWEERKKWEIE